MKVLGGSFKPGVMKLSGTFELKTQGGEPKRYDAWCSIQNGTPISATNRTPVLTKAGWSVAGALALGPIGALAGVLGGGNKAVAHALVVFKDRLSAVVECSVTELASLIGFAKP